MIKLVLQWGGELLLLVKGEIYLGKGWKGSMKRLKGDQGATLDHIEASFTPVGKQILVVSCGFSTSYIFLSCESAEIIISHNSHGEAPVTWLAAMQDQRYSCHIL